MRVFACRKRAALFGAYPLFVFVGLLLLLPTQHALVEGANPFAELNIVTDYTYSLSSVINSTGFALNPGQFGSFCSLSSFVGSIFTIPPALSCVERVPAIKSNLKTRAALMLLTRACSPLKLVRVAMSWGAVALVAVQPKNRNFSFIEPGLALDSFPCVTVDARTGQLLSTLQNAMSLRVAVTYPPSPTPSPPPPPPPIIRETEFEFSLGMKIYLYGIIPLVVVVPVVCLVLRVYYMLRLRRMRERLRQRMDPFEAMLRQLNPQSQPGPPRREMIALLPSHNYDATQDSEGTTCAVCLEALQTGQRARTLQCQHTYHLLCIDQWLATSPLCPTCRANVFPTSSAEGPGLEPQLRGLRFEDLDPIERIRLPPPVPLVLPPRAMLVAAPRLTELEEGRVLNPVPARDLIVPVNRQRAQPRVAAEPPSTYLNPSVRPAPTLAPIRANVDTARRAPPPGRGRGEGGQEEEIEMSVMPGRRGMDSPTRRSPSPTLETLFAALPPEQPPRRRLPSGEVWDMLSLSSSSGSVAADGEGNDLEESEFEHDSVSHVAAPERGNDREPSASSRASAQRVRGGMPLRPLLTNLSSFSRSSSPPPPMWEPSPLLAAPFPLDHPAPAPAVDPAVALASRHGIPAALAPRRSPGTVSASTPPSTAGPSPPALRSAWSEDRAVVRDN